MSTKGPKSGGSSKRMAARWFIYPRTHPTSRRSRGHTARSRRGCAGRQSGRKRSWGGGGKRRTRLVRPLRLSPPRSSPLKTALRDHLRAHCRMGRSPAVRRPISESRQFFPITGHIGRFSQCIYFHLRCQKGSRSRYGDRQEENRRFLRRALGRVSDSHHRAEPSFRTCFVRIRSAPHRTVAGTRRALELIGCLVTRSLAHAIQAVGTVSATLYTGAWQVDAPRGSGNGGIHGEPRL